MVRDTLVSHFRDEARDVEAKGSRLPPKVLSGLLPGQHSGIDSLPWPPHQRLKEIYLEGCAVIMVSIMKSCSLLFRASWKVLAALTINRH